MNALSLTLGNEKFNIPKAPTKEEMSFRTYTARQRLNRLRRAACRLFTSDAMVKAIQRLELEVEAKRLLVRKDRHLWKDIGMFTLITVIDGQRQCAFEQQVVGGRIRRIFFLPE